MKYQLIVLVILLLSVVQVHGQSASKCSIDSLIVKARRIGHLSENEVRDMLLIYGRQCGNNAEFSELSNGVLFRLLEDQTELTLKAMDKFSSQIEVDVILSILSNPVNDLIDVSKIIPKVELVEFDKRLKNDVLEHLRIAYDKLH